MANSFVSGDGTIVNAGNGQVASAQTGQIVQRDYAFAPKWKNRKGKGGRQGTGRPDVTVDWKTAAEMEAQRQNNGVMPTVPAWQGQQMQTGFAPAWQTQRPLTGSFLAGGGAIVRQPAQNLFPTANTRWVRTNKGPQAVPLQTGMLTGTFFSGGSPALNPPSGEDYSWQGNQRNENVNIIPVAAATTTNTTTNNDPFSSRYKGYGGGGGGYERTPSWLQNLYNWNFKG